MTYLKKGETYRSRLEDLLEDFRAFPSNASTSRDRVRDEAALLISLIHADAAEALVSATLGAQDGAMVEAGPDLVTVDDAVKSFDYAFSAEVPFRQSRGRFLRDLCGADRDDPKESPELVTLDDALAAWEIVDNDATPVRSQAEARAHFLRILVGAEPEPAPAPSPEFSFTPESISKLSDSLALKPNADGSTPHLPGEQVPAFDPEPEVDFDVEIGKASDLDAVEPADDLETFEPDRGQNVDDAEAEDDADLDDFRPAKTPAAKPETPLQKAAKAAKKKGTK